VSEPRTLKLIVATFANPAGAARALATIAPALGPGKLGQAAIVSKGPDGKILSASCATPVSRTTP
jgi:hypothetical protein